MTYTTLHVADSYIEATPTGVRREIYAAQPCSWKEALAPPLRAVPGAEEVLAIRGKILDNCTIEDLCE